MKDQCFIMGWEIREDGFDSITGAMMETKNEWMMCECAERTRCGKRDGYYSKLRYDVSEFYWGNTMNVHRTDTIIKVRGGKLNSNAYV